MRTSRSHSDKNQADKVASREAVQQVLLSYEGCIVDSDEQIFQTENLRQCAVFDWLPFFEGWWPLLFADEFRMKETLFQGVQLPLAELPGIYDFHFLAVDYGQQPTLVWGIVERTPYYMGLRRRQQRKIETRLALETA